MSTDTAKLGSILGALHGAYARGENVMDLARNLLGTDCNDTVATLLAYDLQTGSYNRAAIENWDNRLRYCRQLVEVLDSIIPCNHARVLEVGCGEGTTLRGMLELMPRQKILAMGFDLSWSRVHEARRFLRDAGFEADLFVADLFRIPLADNSVDIVFSSHSLEPNGGREIEAIRECLRVARSAVVLFEPTYELVSPEAQARMRSHGYVRGLREAALKLGTRVQDYRLLDYSLNPMNPTGVLVLGKDLPSGNRVSGVAWVSPLTGAPLTCMADLFADKESGLVYPVLRGIPLLRVEHAVVASALCAD